MAGYNITRVAEVILEKNESSPPSFSVHLYPDYWNLNNGSKFLYNNQVASLLDDIRSHRIPVDFLELFDYAKVPFYDGCLIVELLDYRPQKVKDPPLEKPERSRVLLHPDGETLWADICLLNQKTGNKWTDNNALEFEARILLSTSPPLCLDPDPHLTRIANHTLRISTLPVPVSLKRKAVVLSPEEDESDKIRKVKIMQFMDPRVHRIHPPSFRLLDGMTRARATVELARSASTDQHVSESRRSLENRQGTENRLQTETQQPQLPHGQVQVQTQSQPSPPAQPQPQPLLPLQPTQSQIQPHAQAQIQAYTQLHSQPRIHAQGYLPAQVQTQLQNQSQPPAQTTSHPSVIQPPLTPSSTSQPPLAIIPQILPSQSPRPTPASNIKSSESSQSTSFATAPTPVGATSTPVHHLSPNHVQARHGNLISQSPQPLMSSPRPSPFPPLQPSTIPARNVPSPAQRPYTQSPQAPTPQLLQQNPQSSQHSQHPHAQVPNFQTGSVGSVHYAAQAASSQRNIPSRGSPGSNQSAQLTPQQAIPQLVSQSAPVHPAQGSVQTQPHPHLQGYSYAHLQQLQHANPQRLNQIQGQDGRAALQAPTLPRSPMNSNQVAMRSSPMVSNQQLANRPPMPNAHTVSQMTHPSQHQGFSMVPQNQYNVNVAQFRQITHAQQPSHPHTLQSQLPNGSQSTATSIPQVQTTPEQYAQMYGYPGVNLGYGMQHAHFNPAYASWPLGRGMPNVISGQQATATMSQPAGHPQQMPMGVGKAVSGGVQGR